MRGADRQNLTADGRLRSGKLAGLGMGRAIFVLSWPILAESLLTSFVGLTDTVLAAGLGEAETDAIAGAAYIAWFIGLVLMAIGVGATALISRSVSSGRQAVANAATAQTVLLGLFCGALAGAVVALLAQPTAGLLSLGPKGTDAFVVYLVLLSVSVPLQGIVVGGMACARGAGDAGRPLLVMLAVNAVNVVASWALAGVDITRATRMEGGVVVRTLLHNPFEFDMGVAGIALGTLAAHAVGAVIMLGFLARGSCGVVLLRHRLRPHWHTMRRLVRVGIPNFLETLGMWAGNFLVVLMVGWVGLVHPGALGAHIVAIRIEAFSFLPGFAMGTAAATLAGQYLGAGSPALARAAVWRCTLIASGVMGVLGAALMIWPHQVVGLFTPQEAHMRLAPPLLRIAGAVQVPFAISIVLRSALRGAGDVRAVMWLTWVTTFAVRLPLAYALSGSDVPLPAWLGGGTIANPAGLQPSLAMLWVALCAELIVRAVVFGWRFAQAGWTHGRV